MAQYAYQPTTGFSAFPPVIKNLLILNGLFFLAQMVPSTNELLLRWLALWPLSFEPSGYPSFYPWQLVSYAFLHGGFGHLFFNMLALYMFGVQVENAWGSRRFGLFYFACVIGAAVAQLVVASMSLRPYPTVGASGGVFGILLAFGMMFPNQEIYFYFFLPVKAKYMVIFYGVIELWAGLANTSPGVAHFAHLGGMVIGFVLIQYWRGKLPLRPRREMLW